MARWSIVLFAALMIVAADIAAAQEAPPGPGVFEVHLIPGGATFFTETDNAPDFVDYALGGAVTWNPSRIFGIEGEVGGSLGIEQSLRFNGLIDDEKPPNFVSYTGNVVVSVPTGGSFVPYGTGGIGAITMFEREELGISDLETFLTGNVGGGAKWYAPNGRWGLRGDYRFMLVRDKSEGPAFFGGEADGTRHGHRVYGAIVLNVMR